MVLHRWSGSSAPSPEMKTGFEPMEYDERNYSIAPSTRKFSLNTADLMRRNTSAKLANPLAGINYAKLEEMGAMYARNHHIGDEEDVRAFRKGAILAQDPGRFAQVQGLTGMELDVFQNEAVVKGGQLFYRYQFGIDGKDPRSIWLTGLLNSAPYLCCAFIGFWLTTPFNSLFGFVNTWWHMFIARFFLGFGIGPKSATVPIYAAETSSPAIRGALVMQWWQMWTAFGIFFGYVADLAFYSMPDPPGIVGLKWRLMMASAMLPTLVAIAFVFMCPESPRWYMSKNRHYKAYQSMVRLRYEKVQAARDVYYMHTL
ncbi:MAG: hypothetical protein ASARMPRED_002206 [Alectoria sarmentosa]|nr:MAG: hypothetical protein ASARMPRED_002206 [Alectoria sarmentosa]